MSVFVLLVAPHLHQTIMLMAVERYVTASCYFLSRISLFPLTYKKHPNTIGRLHWDMSPCSPHYPQYYRCFLVADRASRWWCWFPIRHALLISPQLTTECSELELQPGAENEIWEIAHWTFLNLCYLARNASVFLKHHCINRTWKLFLIELV